MIKAYSYAYQTLPPEVLTYQKKVFDKLKLPLTQITGNFNHGQFLEHILKTSTDNFVVFFDADCIPLVSNFYDIIYAELSREKCIFGIEQTANPRFHVYAGPACLALPVQIYKDFNYPCLNQTHRSDVAEELTWHCEEKQIPVKYFKVSNIEQPKWRLGYDKQFGIGTTYSYNDTDVLYHQFEIRLNTQNFLNKCIQILNT